jgi:hypothetical protein
VIPFYYGSGTVITYGSGSVITYGSGFAKQKVTVPTVPVPQHCLHEFSGTSAEYAALMDQVAKLKMCAGKMCNSYTFK